KPKNKATQKIKKNNTALHIELEPTVDVLYTLSKTKKKQLIVGFALETENEVENAKKKLKNKNLDLIVLNSLNTKGAGFHVDTNKVTIIDKNEKITTFKMKSKTDVAIDIVNEIIPLINE